MKKLKNNSSGFVLAETLVVTVFLLAIFAAIYSGFYPLMGEFEKRETYDDVDGKYSAYWIKKLIQDSSYDISSNADAREFFKKNGYVRFECKDIKDDNKQNTCRNMVTQLEIDNCDKYGNNCEIYITPYQIGSTQKNVNVSGKSYHYFKETVANSKDLKKYQVNCNRSDADCKSYYKSNCEGFEPSQAIKDKCAKQSTERVFKDGFKDYIYSLPDYTAESLNFANYRVIIAFHNKKDSNNYYSYATIEVSK